MSIESDASKWKSNVSRILEVDPEGILLTETVKKYFDEVASVFKKGTFDAENTKKLLKVLRGRNTRLSGKPIAVELSSFINITERYATKTEDAFASFAKLLTLSSTSPRSHQVQSSRQNPSPDSLDFSELDGPANGSPSRTPPFRTQPNPSPRLNSLTAYGRQVQQRVVENPFADEVEKKSKAPWVIGIILLIIGAILVVNYMNNKTNHSDLDSEKKKGNNSGVINGNIVKGTMKDSRDGKVYKTVRIGDQVWMAENLNYNGIDSWCYKDNSAYCSRYGARLYTWETAMSACPSEWHLPSLAELKRLINSATVRSLGAGESLKSRTLWAYRGNGVDALLFTALPAGYRGNDGKFNNWGSEAYFWSSTEYNNGNAYGMALYNNFDDAPIGIYSKFSARSVRCIKD